MRHFFLYWNQVDRCNSLQWHTHTHTHTHTHQTSCHAGQHCIIEHKALARTSACQSFVFYYTVLSCVASCWCVCVITPREVSICWNDSSGSSFYPVWLIFFLWHVNGIGLCLLLSYKKVIVNVVNWKVWRDLLSVIYSNFISFLNRIWDIAMDRSKFATFFVPPSR